MLKLMKYEFRKTAFSKLILLSITLLSEIVYLLGIFLKKDVFLSSGLCFWFCVQLWVSCTLAWKA